MFQALLRNERLISLDPVPFLDPDRRSRQKFRAPVLPYLPPSSFLSSSSSSCSSLSVRAKKKRHTEKDTVVRRRAGIQASKREGKRCFASFFSPTYWLEGAGKALRRGKTTQQTRQAGQRGSLKRPRLNLVMWSPKETWKNRYERLTFHSPFFEGAQTRHDLSGKTKSRESGVCAVASEKKLQNSTLRLIHFFTGTDHISDVLHFLPIFFF